MANKLHLDILKQGKDIWNQWRNENLEVAVDLTGANLSGINLSAKDSGKVLFNPIDLGEVDLRRANFHGANLRGAYFANSDLGEANLSSTDLYEADLSGAGLWRADLTDAYLLSANFYRASLEEAKLIRADLTNASLVETNLDGCDLTDCRVYGVSAWKLSLNNAKQVGLIITPPDERTITVGDLEVAQFVNLLLDHEKVRAVIDTICEKAVLVLGGFSPGRKEILEALAAKLKDMGFIPIVFDFERPKQRDLTETIRILAGFSLFVIADITSPRSSPLELQATIPDYMIPFVPIIQEGETPFAMFVDLQRKYPWVLPVITYDTRDSLLRGLEHAVVNPALLKHKELLLRKTENLKISHIREVASSEKAP